MIKQEFFSQLNKLPKWFHQEMGLEQQHCLQRFLGLVELFTLSAQPISDDKEL